MRIVRRLIIGHGHTHSKFTDMEVLTTTIPPAIMTSTRAGTYIPSKINHSKSIYDVHILRLSHHTQFVQNSLIPPDTSGSFMLDMTRTRKSYAALLTSKAAEK